MAGISAPFNSPSAAESAYFGDDGGDGDGDGDGGNGDNGATWGELQRSTELGSGWVLAYQPAANSDRRRWFVIRTVGSQNDTTLQAVKSNGSVYEAQDSDSLGQLPHYETESEARNAFESWASSNENSNGSGDNGNGSGDSTAWGEWRKVRKVGPWFIFGRTSSDGSQAQFIVAGKREGTTIYLAPGGEIVESPHIYSNIEKAKQALDAYQQGVENGDIPPGIRPNGNVPNTSTVREAVRKVVRSSQSQTKTSTETKLAGKKVLLGGVAVAGLAILKKKGENK